MSARGWLLLLFVLGVVGAAVSWWWARRPRRLVRRGDILLMGGEERRVVRVDYQLGVVTTVAARTDTITLASAVHRTTSGGEK